MVLVKYKYPKMFSLDIQKFSTQLKARFSKQYYDFLINTKVLEQFFQTFENTLEVGRIIKKISLHIRKLLA